LGQIDLIYIPNRANFIESIICECVTVTAILIGIAIDFVGIADLCDRNGITGQQQDRK
jgi:hypothetical protein